MSHYSELCGLLFVVKRVRGAKTSIAQEYSRKEGGTTANFQIPSFGELRKVSHYSELCGLFFPMTIVRKAKTSIAQQYNRKEGGTTANFQIPNFAVRLTFR